MHAEVLAASRGFSVAQIALSRLLPTALLQDLQNHPASEREDCIQMLE